jgi:hypothetical protein
MGLRYYFNATLAYAFLIDKLSGSEARFGSLAIKQS